jgi:hypothetical protein
MRRKRLISGIDAHDNGKRQKRGKKVRESGSERRNADPEYRPKIKEKNGTDQESLSYVLIHKISETDDEPRPEKPHIQDNESDAEIQQR